VRFSLVCATSVAGLSAIFALATPARAQQGVPPLGARPSAPPSAVQPAAPAPAGTSVVLIDVAYVFKNHIRFNARMNEIKREIEQYDAFVREETKKLTAKKEALVQYNQNSPEYKRLEEEGARISADLQIKVQQKRKEFLELEAKLYYDTYREVEQTVTVFAQRHRINLVLRFTGDDIKPDDRASILQGVNRPVVFQQGLDITENILALLNPPGQTVPPAGAAAPIAPSANRGPTIPQRPAGTIQR
jgi:Skp family chaperone for outer membrane proteins